jgi:hypothetical protein
VAGFNFHQFLRGALGSRAFLLLMACGIALAAALPAKAGPLDAAVQRYRPYLVADIDWAWPVRATCAND